MVRKAELIEDWVDYLPEIDGNREDDDPMVLEIHPMSSEQMRAFHRRMDHKLGKAKDMARARKIIERLMAENVRNIRNYWVGRDEIITGEELAKHGETKVIDEVFDAITEVSVLKEGMPGKSRSRSASSTRETKRPGNGVAQGASPTPKTPKTEIGFDPSETVTTKETRTSAGDGLLLSGAALGRR